MHESVDAARGSAWRPRGLGRRPLLIQRWSVEMGARPGDVAVIASDGKTGDDRQLSAGDRDVRRI